MTLNLDSKPDLGSDRRELIEMTRKISFTVAVLFVERGTTLQLIITSALAVFFLVIQE